MKILKKIELNMSFVITLRNPMITMCTLIMMHVILIFTSENYTKKCS